MSWTWGTAFLDLLAWRLSVRVGMAEAFRNPGWWIGAVLLQQVPSGHAAVVLLPCSAALTLHWTDSKVASRCRQAA